MKKTRSANAARKRLQLIYDLSKNKKCCEGGDVIDTRFDKENISKVIIGHFDFVAAIKIMLLLLLAPWRMRQEPATVSQDRHRVDGRMERVE